METEVVEDVAEWLQTAIGVPFVVVGGSAIERSVPVGTKDIDVLVRTSDWETIDRALERRKDASPLEPMSGTIRGTVLTIGHLKIDLEFISGKPFSGRASPDSFIEFVQTEGSRVFNGIRYATPAVVFYMRLVAPEDWRAYLPSIERDLDAGIPESTLDRAIGVAERFGLGSTVRERVEYLRKKLWK